ncbi:hypothetical protein MPUL_00560 [Mycolicibacterium pulveris]|uniref:Uncharacterized protein n=2 Tax=Mycolicibacterium pulveris TaxID=36813 RepID=A0A7I7UBT4_MYCPV|nr:hypothetical protein MPUL_00560 [Mycolicibacterium pulveris]
MSSSSSIESCPYCGRMVSTKNNRFKFHSRRRKAAYDQCPMSFQRVPITGETPTAYVSRAHLVADLAQQVQDEDPAVVWTYLTALPANELQRLMMVALAAIPVDRRVEDMFAWVCDLPVAKGVGA